jgi:hypothetical protein
VCARARAGWAYFALMLALLKFCFFQRVRACVFFCTTLGIHEHVIPGLPEKKGQHNALPCPVAAAANAPTCAGSCGDKSRAYHSENLLFCSPVVR